MNGFFEQINFKSLYPGADDDALDLLEQMLRFIPSKRVGLPAALNHRFFDSIRNCNHERESAQSAKPLKMEDELLLEASDQVLQNVIEEIDKYRPMSMSVTTR